MMLQWHFRGGRSQLVCSDQFVFHEVVRGNGCALKHGEAEVDQRWSILRSFVRHGSDPWAGRTLHLLEGFLDTVLSDKSDMLLAA